MTSKNLLESLSKSKRISGFNWVVNGCRAQIKFLESTLKGWKASNKIKIGEKILINIHEHLK